MAKNNNNVTLLNKTVNKLAVQTAKNLEAYILSDDFREMVAPRMRELLKELTTAKTVKDFQVAYPDLAKLIVTDNTNLATDEILIIRDELRHQYKVIHQQFCYGVEMEQRIPMDPIAYAILIEHLEKHVERQKDVHITVSMLRNKKKHSCQYGALGRLCFPKRERDYFDKCMSPDDFVTLGDMLEEMYNKHITNMEKEDVKPEKDLPSTDDASPADSNSAPEDIEVIGTVNPDGTITLESDLLQEVDAPTATVIAPVSKNSYSDILSFIQISDSLKEDFELETLLEAEEQIKEFLEMADRIEKLGISMPVLLEKKEMLMEFFEYSINLNKAS